MTVMSALVFSMSKASSREVQWVLIWSEQRQNPSRHDSAVKA
jgi:hypothetical protein